MSGFCEFWACFTGVCFARNGGYFLYLGVS